MKKFSVRIKAVLVAAAFVVSLSLASCTSFLKGASLSTATVEDNAVLPVVSGFFQSDSINEKLRDAFLPVANQMAQISDDSDGRIRVEYTMTEQKEGLFGSKYAVTMYLSDDSDSIELKTVNISGLNTVKALDKDDLEWLNSTDIAEGALLMKRLGMEFEPETLGENSTERNAAEVFVKLYESFIGEETDISQVSVDCEPLLKKAYLLGFVDFYGSSDYTFDDTVYLYRVSTFASKVLTSIERDAFGRQSDTVTGEEFVDILRALYNAMRVHEVDGAENKWSDLGTIDTDEILRTMEVTDQSFTRRDAAELLGRITKDGVHYAMKYSDRNLDRVDDAFDSIWVRRAVTHGFMNYYGDSTLFAPQEELTVVNAISSAQCYLTTRYNDWAYSLDYAWDGYLTNADVMVSAAKIAEYFDDRTDSDKDFEVKCVINDRDYDWFFSQKNTGQYSAVNCMPSIATMASHWYDKNSDATVEKMRQTSDNDDGWTAFELRSGLSAYNVPFTVEDASIENITKALDAGGIVLAQYSDRPYGISGHCYVIYGYRQFKDSTTFIVNDSDSLTQRAELFGRRDGNGDEIEARFSIWTISRFVDDVTVIGVDDGGANG